MSTHAKPVTARARALQGLSHVESPALPDGGAFAQAVRRFLGWQRKQRYRRAERARRAAA